MAKNIYVQRMRDKRKQNSLCINCGKTLDREGIYCLSCRDKINEDAPPYRKIKRLIVRKTDFVKNTSQKLIRFAEENKREE